MNNNNPQRREAMTWRRYSRGGWAIMASLHRMTRIGVLSVAMLATTQVQATSEVRTVKADHDTAASAEAVIDSLDEVTVTGTVAPLTALQAARIVQVITSDEIRRSAAQTVNDILKLATGVDVRQRGGFGIQTDISIDGATFDQIAILLNGIDIGNPQTGHHTADFPVQPQDIERIEILEGAAGRAYGNAAFGGAVNIVTRRDTACTAEVGAQGGSYGTFGADARTTFVGQSLSASYIQSDGGTQNSAFNRLQAYASGEITSGHNFRAFWQAGVTQKQYGANTFYSAAYPNQWEGQRRYIISVQAEAKAGRVTFNPSVYWQRAADHFQLIHRTTTGENFHRADVYGAALKGHIGWRGGKTAFGADVRQEIILSSNLGRPMDSAQFVPLRYHDDVAYTRHDNRTLVSYYIEHNVLLSHWTISAGIRAVMNTSAGNTMRYYPGIDVAWRPITGCKLYASYNKGFRLPTFTDLYYKSPTQDGNQGLRPEEQHSMQIGMTWRHDWLTATVRGFMHRGHNMIDWVMYTADDKFHSTAFDLDNYGVQVSADARFKTVHLDVGYTWMHQKRHDDAQIYKSNYALEYLRHKFTARLSHPIVSHLNATWDFRLCDRNGAYIAYPENVLTRYRPYAVLDVKLQWDAPHYNLWVSAQNVTNHRYYDLGNIPQPGIWLMAGARWRL